MSTPQGRYHWSNTALEAQFWRIPASASLPWLLLLFYPRKITLIIAVILTLFFCYMKLVKRMSVIYFLLKIKVLVTGRVKSTKKFLK